LNILEIKDVTVKYDALAAVDNVSFNVKQGDFLGIIGPNGAGKTTLFKSILGFMKFEGEIKLFNYYPSTEYRLLLPLIGYIPQKMSIEKNFPATVNDIISMGIIPEKRITKANNLIKNKKYMIRENKSQNPESRISEMLELTGLESMADKLFNELSGGEQQRAFVAKTLINYPNLLILDEPVNGFDMDAQNKFYEILTKINKKNNTTIILASHDLNVISKLTNKVACMNRTLFFHGNKDEFFSNSELLETYSESAMQMHLKHHT